MKTPQQRINKLIKDLKTTPYQIGLVYLEHLLVNLTNDENFMEGYPIGHKIDLKNRINKYLKS